MAGSFPVTHKPVQVVPDAGCRAEVIANGDVVFYGPWAAMDPSNVAGKLGHNDRLTLDDPMWFMTGGSATLTVIQQRFCRRCGWVDGGGL